MHYNLFKGKILSKMDLRRILCSLYRVGDNLKLGAAGSCEMLAPVCVTLRPRLWSSCMCSMHWESQILKNGAKLDIVWSLLRHHTVKIYIGEWRYILHSLIALALDGAEWSALCFVLFSRLDGSPDWSGIFRGQENLLFFQEFNYNFLCVHPVA